MDEVEETRKRLGLKQTELAEVMGVSIRMYRYYVADGAPTVKISKLKRLLREIEVGIEPFRI
jgi:transcriptional regulator with XRE-family HTH domain